MSVSRAHLIALRIQQRNGFLAARGHLHFISAVLERGLKDNADFRLVFRD